jgi:hypothetical protein
MEPHHFAEAGSVTRCGSGFGSDGFGSKAKNQSVSLILFTFTTISIFKKIRRQKSPTFMLTHVRFQKGFKLQSRVGVGAAGAASKFLPRAGAALK